MQRIDVAIDDYMHVIVRTRPWTKKLEEGVLEGFAAWLQTQPNAPVFLHEISPEHVQRYIGAAELSSAEQRDLHEALHNLHLWAAKQGWIEQNRFDAIAA